MFRERFNEGKYKMTAKQFYEQIGQEYMEIYERMTGSEALIRRFLKQFCEDGTFSALEKAVEEGDIKQIFLEAHTLKGLSANLGLKPLSEKTGVLVELTRNNDREENILSQDYTRAEEKCAENSAGMNSEDYEKITGAFAEIRDAYQKIVKLIGEVHETDHTDTMLQ